MDRHAPARIPEGDVAAAIDAAARAAIAGSGRFERADGVLRRWPVAGLSLLALTALFAVGMIAAR